MKRLSWRKGIGAARSYSCAKREQQRRSGVGKEIGHAGDCLRGIVDIGKSRLPAASQGELRKVIGRGGRVGGQFLHLRAAERCPENGRLTKEAVEGYVTSVARTYRHRG